MQDKSQEETLVVTKKISNNEQNKRCVEATFKSCIVVHPLPNN